MCIQCFYLLASVVICFTHNVLCSESATALVVPVQIINSTTHGVCPSGAKIEEAKQQLREDISSALERSRYPLGAAANPASSCSQLPADSPAGYYWIQPAIGTQPVQLYCKASPGECGGSGLWARVAFLNMSDPNEVCPSNWTTQTSPIQTCGSGANSGLTSVIFPTSGIAYRRVCGRIVAYHAGGF